MSTTSLLAVITACAISTIAQASGIPGDWLTSLLSSGPIGAVLLWFMLRNERRMRYLSGAVDRMTRASMVLILTSRRATEGEQQLARNIVAEVEEAEKREAAKADS